MKRIAHADGNDAKRSSMQEIKLSYKLYGGRRAGE